MKKHLLLSLVFITSCTTTKPIDSRLPSQTESCAPSDQYPYQPFTILQSGPNGVVIKLDGFKKLYSLDNTGYDYTVKHIETKVLTADGKTSETVHDIARGHIDNEPFTFDFPVKYSGLYFVELTKNGAPFWKQKVFALNKEESTLTDGEKNDLAKKFAPVVELAVGELYYPSTLDYIFNKVDVDPELAEEKFRITTLNANIGHDADSGFAGRILGKILSPQKYPLNISFPFKDIDKVMPYFGHSESVLRSEKLITSTRTKFRQSDKHIAIYYSVFENKFWNEIYINYHFLYPFDSKVGPKDKSAIAAHIFDRESMTVVLRKTSKRPLYVIYGAHLERQNMAQIDSQGNVIQRWKTGRTYVNWDKVISESGRVKPAIAIGSHGVYPIKGFYAVMATQNNNIPLIVEPTGGGKKLYPEFEPTAGDNLKYKLIPLNLGQVTANCDDPNRMLTYSGNTINMLGPQNTAWPPFTNREADYKNYADPNAPMFNMDAGRKSQ